ncbi:MAG: phosphoglycerate kinase [Candidatus Rokubacteria bacterium]|nr:phosphoglycerate kinase [Candidatus Rokubacteria bacterium]
MAKLSVEELDLEGRRVFLRADLNVPLAGPQPEAGEWRVADDSRLRAVLPTLQHCMKSGALVILASHLGRPKGTPDPKYSLAPVARRLGELLGQPVPLAPDCVGEVVEARVRQLEPGQVLLLENLRFHPEEEGNVPAFAQALARLADLYVNDAFAAAHRAHASIEAITRYLSPAAAGLLMRRELEALGRILERPERPLVAILGGAKVSDKLALVEHLLERVDSLLIGGGMAFTFLTALGHGVGRSLVEPERIEMARQVLAQANRLGVPVGLPVDTVVGESTECNEGRAVGIREIPDQLMGLDIGPQTLARFTQALRGAKTAVWNGPMGVFERPPFSQGTLGLARAVAMCGAFSVVGGGDTVAAIHQAGVSGKIGYVSTAGGAFLEFLEGRALPGVVALTDRS